MYSALDARVESEDCVIVAAASKSKTPCELALQMCRDRGRIVVVGAVEMSFPWQEMYLKEIQLFMSRAYGPGSYDPAYEKQGRDYPFPYVRWTENRNMEEFLRLVGLQAQSPALPDRLRAALFTLESAASPDNRERLDSAIQRRIPCVSLSPYCALDRALELAGHAK